MDRVVPAIILLANTDPVEAATDRGVTIRVSSASVDVVDLSSTMIDRGDPLKGTIALAKAILALAINVVYAVHIGCADFQSIIGPPT